MALQFPLDFADFFDLIPADAVTWAPMDQRQKTGLRGGEILTAEVAPTLWGGSVQLPTMRARRAAQIEAILTALTVPNRAFYARKLSQIGPANDPLGAALTGFDPQIESVAQSTSEIALNGLPVGYELQPGDMLSFSYGANPVRQAFHRLTQGGTAGVGGITPLMELAPHMRPGALAGADVQLVKPYFKAILVPGSVDYGSTRGGKTSGMSFSFQQTLS